MIRIGIICPSEIAFRRFLPSLEKAEGIVFAAIGMASPEEWFGDLSQVTAEQIAQQQDNEYEKAKRFTDTYGGKVIKGYQALVTSDEIDAVYLPLPPALHYQWAKMALANGKHVLVEKPSTTCLAHTDALIALAEEKGLALHENYMFVYHDQLSYLHHVVASGEIGEVRLYRITFGFPRRAQNDFRYNKALGGGALLDAGGYCLKYANYLLGNTAKVTTAQINFIDDFEVEVFGSASLVNEKGLTAQIAFGMDNDYRCDIEIWGAQGTITSNRILTAPAGLVPTYNVKKNQTFETHDLPADDAFLKSVERFIRCVNEESVRKEEYEIIRRQSALVDEFKRHCE